MGKQVWDMGEGRVFLSKKWSERWGIFADGKMHKPCGLDVRYRHRNKPPEILRRLAPALPALEDDTGGGGRPQVAPTVFVDVTSIDKH